MYIFFFVMLCGSLFSGNAPNLLPSFSLDSLDFADGSWRRSDDFQSFEQLTQQLDVVDVHKVDAFALHRPFDEVFIENVLQNFEGIQDVKEKKFLHLSNIINERFKQTVLLVMIFQEDLPFVCDENFMAAAKVDIEVIEKTINYSFFNGVLLGKPLLHYLVVCKNIPRNMREIIQYLTITALSLAKEIPDLYKDAMDHGKQSKKMKKRAYVSQIQLLFFKF